VPQFGDLLDRARELSFVGRRDELAAFGATLSGRSARRVLFLHGAGGIGKTTLTHEFGRRARAAGRTVRLVDGREIDPSPAGFREAVGTDLPAGTVLLVDGYEHLEPIDGWLRREFLPARSAGDVVVLAGRDEPAAAWRTDPGWRCLVAIHRLDAFDAADSAELLARAGVAPEVRARLVTVGHGHPLAMALLADAAATGTVPNRLAEAPELISALLGCLVVQAPSEAHAVGLATCALAWLTTEDLLRETVGPRAPEVWAWLCRRPFVTYGPRGIHPHDLARDVLEAEFQRRSPEQCRDLHRVVHRHVLGGIRAASGTDRQLLAQHLLFLHRRSPLTAAFDTLRARYSATLAPGRPEDHDAVVATVERFQGAGSAAVLRGWLTAQPGQLAVVRTDEGLAGFAFHEIHPTDAPVAARDPVTRAALAHVARYGPTRPGEQINLARFVSGTRDHQRDLYAVLAGSVSSIVEWLTRPLAWSFAVFVDPEFWGPFFDHLGFAPAFEVEAFGWRHVAYAHDWRRLPVDPWLAMMGEREHSGGTGPPPAHLLRPPPIDRPAFASAVRRALADLHRPDRLAGNPLLGTALAADASPEGLRATLETGVRALADRPRGDSSAAVLNRTYVRAAPTQEAAAEVLGLPFSTYRRHLAKALEELTDLLWAVEIGEIRLPGQRSGSD
jgi:hypothetical protein